MSGSWDPNDLCEMSEEKGQTATPTPDHVLEIVLENVLCFLTSRRDRNAASLVCKSWYRAEALTRSEVFIGNCYSISPQRVTQRFRKVKSVIIKGKPRLSDFNLLPRNWGAYFSPWLVSMVDVYPGLEKVYLKRMRVTNDDLVNLVHYFSTLKDIVLVRCEGFGTSGLAFLASECRNIRVLDLIDCDVSDDEADWISCFPDCSTSLESLTFDCIDSPVNFEALERLVIRSPSLKKLSLNEDITIEQLYRLMVQAPQLTHLGTGSFSPSEVVADGEQEPDYASAFAACKSLACLSGFKDIDPDYLIALNPVCGNLVTLNFSSAYIDAEQLKSVICCCYKLKSLCVLDSVTDEGLQAVAATCKDLLDLRVFQASEVVDTDGHITEVGLLAISVGCRKLQSILYSCHRMTNAAVIALSNNCPDLEVFRLRIYGVRINSRYDPITGEAMDEGFGAIVKNSKKLTRLSASCPLTDEAFSYIGQYGKLLRTLCVEFGGNSDLGLRYVLEGCPMLRKLELWHSPFGDLALHAGLHHYYNMRFLWLSSCRVTRKACQQIARQLPGLAVEVISRDEKMRERIARLLPRLVLEDREETSEYVDKLYMYRSLEGP